MTAVTGVGNNAAGASSGASQDQGASAVNQVVGLVGQTTFQMLFSQLQQNAAQFQDAMEDPTMDTSDDS